MHVRRALDSEGLDPFDLVRIVDADGDPELAGMALPLYSEAHYKVALDDVAGALALFGAKIGDHRRDELGPELGQGFRRHQALGHTRSGDRRQRVDEDVVLLAFEAQRNPATPWLRSGRWDSAELLRHDSPGLSHVSAVWTGASWDLLRLAPAEGGANLQQWLRLNSDGAPDPHHGVDGVRERRFFGVALTLEMLWTGNDRRISAVNDALAGLSVHLDDADGAPVAAFGANGIAVVADAAGIDGSVAPQLGFFTLPAFVRELQTLFLGDLAGLFHLFFELLFDGCGALLRLCR